MVYNKPKEARFMEHILREVNSPLFSGIQPQELDAMLGCIGYHIGCFYRSLESFSVFAITISLSFP